MRVFALTPSLFFCLTATYAQQNFNGKSSVSTSITSLSVEHCVFPYADERICYVYLERFPSIIREAVLVDANDEHVLAQPILGNSVDSIVELDYTTLPAGEDTLELYSFQNKLTKSLRL